MRLIVLLSFFAVTFGSSISLTREKRVVVGGDASIDEFPWQVSIQYMGHVCSGIIIAQEWVLTTASCVAGLSEQLTTIRYGSSNHNYGGHVVQVGRIVTHGLYDRRTSTNDIALVRAVRIFTDIKPVLLARKTDPILLEGTKLSVSGWGLQSVDNAELADRLKKTTLDFIPISQCEESYRGFGITLPANYQLCAGKLNNGGPSICQGDVGGPLYLGALKRVYGIAKFALACGGPGRPTIFTDVSAYRIWIEGETGLRPDI